MPTYKQPQTYLRIWDRERLNDPSLTLERFALQQCIPLKALKSRIDTAYRAREAIIARRHAVNAGAVTTLELDAPDGWSQWILFQSDNHHDSIFCNRELEQQHLNEAVKRGAVVMILGDLFDGMQGRYDNRRTYTELRPEYKREDYYDFLWKDMTNFLFPYAAHIALIADGNHELSILKNANTDVLGNLITNLQLSGADIKRGGFGGWVRLVLNLGDGRKIVKRIKYYHGSGGEAPVTRGAIQTNRQAVYLPDADIVINGHSHNHYHIPISRERLSDDGRHYFDLQHHIRVPGYKQAYGDGSRGWEVTRGGVPKPIGAVWVQLSRRGDEIITNILSDIRGADTVIGDATELYNGVVYSQDSEGY